jgi:F-box interacting protein
MSTKRQHLITTTRWILSEEFAIISYYPLDSVPLQSILTSKGTRLDYSPDIQHYRYGLVASCDGLLCFLINDHQAYIYNPCIRKVKQLPYIDLPHVSKYCHYAFGYDPFIDNYKVIVVQENDRKTEIKVHTLGTDSWRRIKNIPSKFRYGRRGIFVSGTVNWLTCYWNGFNDLKAIVSLHLGKESYQEIPVPDNGNFIFDSSTLDIMRDCLCIFSRRTFDSPTDVWLMKEYGDKDSWIKLFRLPYFGDSGYFFTRILYISEDNHVMVVFKELGKLNWVVYDYKNDTIKCSKIEEKLIWVESKVYAESLISP